MRSSGKLVLIGVVGLLAYIVAVTALRMTAGEDVRDATLAAACLVTSCAGPGLAFLGWLMIMTLPAVVAALVVGRRRLGIATTIVVAAAYSALAFCFVPGRRGPELDQMLRGPGADPFVGGMNWGFGTIGAVAALAIALGALSTKVSWHRGVYLGAVAVTVLGMMTAAIVRAVPAYPPAVMLIGPSTTVGDDVLTRTAVSERDGCDGILVDPTPLDGCLHTAEFEVTTSDSDAAVRFSAVMFADNDAAWDAWGEIHESTPPAGIEGNTLLVTQVTSEWLTVAAVRHADGRPIAPADEPWLRWPAEQLRYVFAHAIGYSIAAEPEPDEEAAPKG